MGDSMSKFEKSEYEKIKAPILDQEESIYPKPQMILNIATARNGNVRFVYEFFDEEKKPHRFQVWKGRRCLLEIFDSNARLPYLLPPLIDEALAAERPNPDKRSSLSSIEKIVCFVLGRGVVWTTDSENIPELSRSMKTNQIAVNRKVGWRLVRLKGWAGPKLMLIVRSWAGGRVPMGSNSTTTIHSFAMSPIESRALRDGLIALCEHPAFTHKKPNYQSIITLI